MMAFRAMTLVRSGEHTDGSFESIASVQSDRSAIAKRLGWLGHNSGFNYFAVIMLGSSPEIIESDIPPEFLQVIVGAGEFGHCSMFARLARSTVAFGWDVGRNSLEGRPDADEVENNDAVYVPILRSVGIEGGFCVPVHTVKGERGVVVLLGPRPEFDNDYPGLVLAAQALFDGLSASHPRFGHQVEKTLGSFEARILMSLRNGWSIDDAAKEMRLSSIGMTHMLRATIAKLGASNVFDAIRIAHERGLIV